MTDKSISRIWQSLVLFGALFELDRYTKYLALDSCGSYDLTSFLSFDVTMNRGIAWGIFHTASTLGFVVLTSVIIAIIGALIWYMWKQLKSGRFAIEETLILAGATSNLWDRLFYSGVIDFIHLHAGAWSFPIFNLADVYIVVGVIWVLFSNYE